MEKKRIELKNGLLLATELWNGKLILAEIRYGQGTKTEMRNALLNAGYNFGLIESSLDLLESGQKGQIPIALAYVDEDPGKPWFHFEDALNDKNFNSWIESGSFDNVDFSYPVQQGDRLMSLAEVPYSFMRYPAGDKEFLKNLDGNSLEMYAGENTKYNIQKNAIESEIDGFAHRTIYGMVSVYPLMTVKNIGKMHGKVEFENALEVEQDVRAESVIVIPSNLIVKGLIRSSYIRVGGNINCAFGFDNLQKSDVAKIYAGQSIFTISILHYTVWAGMYVICQNTIESSNIQAMNTIVAPVIANSEIKVGSKLYCRDIERGTQIYLGPDYVIDPNLKNIKNYHNQHEKKLYDLYLSLEEQQRELEFTKKKAIGHLAKLSKMSKASISSDVLLNRFYINMKDGLRRYNEAIENCKQTLDSFEDERKQLNFYETHTRDAKVPEITVTGRISAGCAIYAPHQTLRIREPLERVSIKLDKDKGTLDIKPL
ncbi:MAG: DUF342 domain-containing protein [Calditrichae bacterium]|nr:DUF342 domain-containing protein [Calditrichota bacterium]MCB9059216.1 DUF342 domain-containing protein [Calditrichia bacterium]